ncbi:hypothetical protein [Paenibacillus medicaginis]|uniref:Uncharacterized protein n=1 Tax=Paenibacillus medicaginis TaxID=1470560 RepID=A0ABV5C2L1_9BACL
MKNVTKLKISVCSMTKFRQFVFTYPPIINLTRRVFNRISHKNSAFVLGGQALSWLEALPKLEYTEKIESKEKEEKQ